MIDDFFRDAFADIPALALLRGMDTQTTLRMVNHVAALGIALLEVPLQSGHSLASLDTAVARGTELSLVVGTGTTLTQDDVRVAHSHGARFTVSPGFDPDVAAESVRLGMPHLPGVATASEVHAARKAGFTVQKAFPASVLGPGWITAMRAPFPDVDFVATGGMTQKNADAYLEAGALAVAFGSSIADVRSLSRSR